MATPQGTVGFDKSLQDVKEALDVLTATLGEVRGCEYPRLIAREIQALIVACVAHDKTKHGVLNGSALAAAAASPTSPVPTEGTVQLLALLEAREAEIARLRDLLHHGVDTIEAHTLTTPDGTAVMLHGDYQCVSAAAVEQWLRRAEAALDQDRRSSA
jgi:hypothetical protein